MVWLGGGWGAALRAELTFVYELDGRDLPVAGVENRTILVERDGVKVKAPPGGTYQIRGDLAANAELVRATLNYGVNHRKVPGGADEARPVSGSVSMRHVFWLGPKKERPSQILEAWPVARKQAGILVAAWIHEGRIVKAAPGGIPAMKSDDSFTFYRRFPLAPEEVKGKGVLLFWSNGVFLPAADHFKEAAANRALHALVRDDAEAFAVAVNRLENVDTRGAEGETLLHLAAAAGATDAVRLLIERGARVNADAAYIFAPLAWAAMNGRRAVVEELLSRGARVDQKDLTGNTALMRAVEVGHVDVARALLAANANPHSEESSHRTPLTVAIDNGLAELAEAMSPKAGKRFWNDDQMRRVLATQARKGNTAMVKLLLAKGVKADRDLGGFTALLGGAASGDPELARVLIEASCPLEVAGADGETALLTACRRGHFAFAEQLLKAGANSSVARRDGSTALHLAVVRDADDLVSLLLAHGANASATDQPGNTPLTLALAAGAGQAARVLVDHGQRLETRQLEALLPAVLQFDLVELIAPLLASRDAVEKPLAGGWTPMQVATLFQAERCITALRAAGAGEASEILVPVRQLDARPKLIAAVEPVDPRDVDEFPEAASVELEVVVGPDGNVLFPAVRSGTDPVLGLAALIAVREWGFAPVTRQGKPAHVRVRMPVRFPPASERVRDVANVDVAPRLIKAVPPDYPAALRRQGEQGRIHVRFTVGVEGRTSDIRVIGSSDPEFNQPVIKAVAQWEFSPGEVDGVPVPTRMEQPVVFSLEN